MVEDQSLNAAILRDERDAGDNRFLRIADIHTLTTDKDLALVDAVDAEDRPRQLGAPAAHETGETKDLTRIEVEANVLHAASGRKIANLEQGSHRAIDRALLPLEGLLHGLADDGVDDLVHRQRGRIFGEDVTAVPQNGDAVGNAEDLVHPVRDVDDRDASFLEALHQREERVRFGRRQRRGRLVHDQDARILGQGLGDLG